MTNRALIFGGNTGLLGRALVRNLTANQWHVACIGRSDGNVLNISFMESCIQKHKPTHIFNTLAYTQVDAAEDDENTAFVLNRAFPAGLAQLTKSYNLHLIHYSTDFCFSGKEDKPYTEESSTDPLSAYGRSKLAGEDAILNLAPEHSCILRTAWLFGPGKDNFVSKILQNHEKDLTIVADQIGSPTYTVDLAHWSMLCATKKLTGIYNAVNSGRASWYELACEAVAVAELPNHICPINSDQWPQKAVRPAFSVLDNSKLAEALGINPRAWPQALREYIFSNHLNRDLFGA